MAETNNKHLLVWSDGGVSPTIFRLEFKRSLYDVLRDSQGVRGCYLPFQRRIIALYHLPETRFPIGIAKPHCQNILNNK